MGSQRAHIILPHDLIEEIDALVGPRGRSAFLVETARAELHRRRLLSFLRSDQPAWKEQNHPEFVQGTGAWVKKLRLQNEGRTSAAKRTRKPAR
jgi:hypothetical protein